MFVGVVKALLFSHVVSLSFWRLFRASLQYIAFNSILGINSLIHFLPQNFIKPNIMWGHNVIYVDTICLCGLHGWSSDSHQSNLSFKSQSVLSPWGSVRIKEHAFPRSSSLAFTITAITSLRKKKKISPPPHPTLPRIGRSSMRLPLSSFIGRISCPTFTENNTDYYCYCCELMPLFYNQFNCHLDKWPNNANTRVASLSVIP